MKILIVLAHPDRSSLNHALAEAAGRAARRNGHDVSVRDLYGEGFDPLLQGDSGEGVPVGLLRARTAIVLNTSNTPPARERAAFGDPLDAIWKRCVFDLCGVKDVRRRTFSVVVTSTAEERLRWLDEAEALVDGAFPRGRLQSP